MNNINQEENDRFFDDTHIENADVALLETKQDILHEAEELDFPKFKKILTELDKAILKNTEAREKYPNEPLKYVESETDLYSCLEHAMQLSESYEYFDQWTAMDGYVPALIQLIMHPNPDIVIQTLSLFAELLDADDFDKSVSDENDKALLKFADNLLSNDLASFLSSKLSDVQRDDSDQIQTQILDILQKLLRIEGSIFGKVIAESPELVSTIIALIEGSSSSSVAASFADFLADCLSSFKNFRVSVSSNSAFCASLLSCLAQSHEQSHEQSYENSELKENLFNCLWLVLQEHEGLTQFFNNGGVPQMLSFIKGKRSYLDSNRAFKTLSFALGLDQTAVGACAFINGGGLKYLFAFLNRLFEKFADVAFEEDLCTILVSLVKAIAFTSDTSRDLRQARARLLAKFLERNCEKARLLVCFYTKIFKIVRASQQSDFETLTAISELLCEAIILLAADPTVGKDIQRVLSETPNPDKNNSDMVEQFKDTSIKLALGFEGKLGKHNPLGEVNSAFKFISELKLFKL